MNFYIQQMPARIGLRQHNTDSVVCVNQDTILIKCSGFIPDALGLAIQKAEELGWKDWTWKAAQNVLVRTAIIALSLSAPVLLKAQADSTNLSRFVGLSPNGDSLFAKCACPPKALATDTINAKPIQERPAHWPKREPLITPIKNERKNNLIH